MKLYFVKPHEMETKKFLKRWGCQMARWKKSTIQAKIWHSKHAKAYQGALGTRVLTSKVSRTGLTGPLNPFRNGLADQSLGIGGA